MKQHRLKNPRLYQGGWAWVWPAVSAAAGWIADNWQRNTAGGKAQHNAQREAYGSVMGKVEAAKAAGLHPLAALGTNTGGPGAGNFASDFAGISDSAAQYTQQRQWKQEQQMAQAQASDSRSAAARAEAREDARLNADLSHTQKQNDWIDEQIRASAEQRLREASNHLKSVRSLDGGEGFPGPMTYYKPHEVTRSINGRAVGVNPSEESIRLPSGEVIQVPFGAQPEQSELMNTLRDISAHYQIPLTVLTGKRLIDGIRNSSIRFKNPFTKTKSKSRSYRVPRR